eukprot:3890563-Pyramimonas_sp.AAC.1
MASGLLPQGTQPLPRSQVRVCDQPPSVLLQDCPIPSHVRAPRPRGRGPRAALVRPPSRATTASAARRARTLGTQERTHAMYVKRVADIESWVSFRGLKLTSARLVDCAQVDYLNQLWIDDADIGEATGTYAAWVKLRPSFSKKGPDELVRTMKALQGFNRLDQGRTRPPLSLAFAALIARELVGMGLGSLALA